MKNHRAPRLLFFVTEDWYFSMHFQHFADAAINSGWNVCLVCNTGQKGETIKWDIERSGIRLIPISFSRSGMTPIQDMRVIFKLLKIIKTFKPNLIHAVALKPILFCHIASLITKTPLIAMITGLGHVFTGRSIKAFFARPIITAFMRSVSRNKISKIVVLNDEDASWVCQNFSSSANVEVIPGTGVDLKRFVPSTHKPSSTFRISFVGRMLTDKGILDLIEAMRILRKENMQVELIMAGEPDPSNPASISREQLEQWEQDGLCRYLGHSKNIEKIYREIDVLLLPSYREGLGMTIIEAAATGIPSIASDVPGCRSAVIDGKTGILIPPRQPREIANAVRYLINNPELRKTMGENARKFAEEKFAKEIVINKFLNLYSEISRKD